MVYDNVLSLMRKAELKTGSLPLLDSENSTCAARAAISAIAEFLLDL